MKSSTGIVMQLDKKHAFIMTNSGEFLKLKVSKTIPKLGEIYTGEVAKDTPFYKYALTAASLAFLLLSGSTAYAYYTPVTSVVVNINPSIKLDLNRWNKIIKSTPLNEDGKKVLSELKVQNKSLNDGLDSIVVEAKKDNFINTSYIQSGKTITIAINSTKQIEDFNLSKFEEHIKSDNINLKISTEVNSKTYDKKNKPTDTNIKVKDERKDDKSNNENNKKDTNINSDKLKKDEKGNPNNDNTSSSNSTIDNLGKSSNTNSQNLDSRNYHDQQNNSKPSNHNNNSKKDKHKK